MAHATKTVVALAALVALMVLPGCGRRQTENRTSLPSQEAKETSKEIKKQPTASESPETSGRSGVAIGDIAPDFKDLAGIDDAKHSLADYKDAELIVLAFTCNHCPVAKAYEDRLVALQRDYQPKGVQLVAVNVNNIPEDRLDAMKVRAKQKGFSFPYLYDATQKVGHDYGAKVTPHVFVLDKSRKIAYMGAIDDSGKADKVKEPYLRRALDALLDGKKPAEAVTRQFGCGIRYE
jgi:peroxiredoxin